MPATRAIVPPGRDEELAMRTADQQKFRVFLSSPADVWAEREAAERMLRAVEVAHDGRLHFEVIRWEKQHYTAAKSFQDQIASPAECDLVICIFWSRLGLELNEKFNRTDGSRRTGSEYEFEVALEHARSDDVPDILVYRRRGHLPAPEAEELDSQAAQYRALDGFFGRWFRSEEGQFYAAYRNYSGEQEFAREFRRDLESWVAQQFERTEWDWAVNGSPFRGLNVYELEHEAVFFGRLQATRKAHARLPGVYCRWRRVFSACTRRQRGGKVVAC